MRKKNPNTNPRKAHHPDNPETNEPLRRDAYKEMIANHDKDQEKPHSGISDNLIFSQAPVFRKSLSEKIKRTLTARKLVLLSVLIAMLVFLLLHTSSFLKTRSYFGSQRLTSVSAEEKEQLRQTPDKAKDERIRYAAGLTPKRNLSMLGTRTLRQTFTARESGLARIDLFFNNPANYQSSGTIRVSVEDRHGNELCHTSLATNLIANAARTPFDFSGNTQAINSNKIATTLTKRNQVNNVKLHRHQRYTIMVQSLHVKSPNAFGLYLMDDASTSDGVLTLNHKAVSGNTALYASIQYYRITLPVFLGLVGALIAAMVLILLPLKSIQRRVNWTRHLHGKPPILLRKRLLRILFFATPFVSFWIMTSMAGSNLRQTLRLFFSFRGLLNMMIIGFLWILAYLCCNRVKYTTMITTLTVFFFCLANAVLLQFRDSPLIASDFVNIGTAMDVAGNYQLQFNRPLLFTMTVTVIWICLNLSLKSHKGLPRKKRLAVLGLTVAWGVLFQYTLFLGPTIKNHDIEVSGFKPKLNYRKNGTLLSFFVTVKTSFVQKPDGYSVEAVQAITKHYTSDRAQNAAVSQKHPNIIVIMNEAYSDLRAVGNIPLNEEYMPFYKSLKTNTIKGTMYSSIFGGSTANTEFEFLTGNSIAFLPFHSVAYANLIKENIPSLTWNLRSEGYGGNIAFHPGMRNSYNRNRVYPRLGFQKHIALEDLHHPEKIRSFVSDQQDYDLIEKEYRAYRSKNKTKPFYLFNVTIQNHSDYKRSSGVINGNIDITDDHLREEEAVQYINLMKKSDDALRSLVNYYRSQKEPTLIVLFGDHQPRVGDTFYEKLLGKESDTLTLEETEKKYKIPFFIWANYDITEQKNVEISANYLSSYLLQQTGGEMTGYNKYLMQLYRKLPVVTAIGYKDKEGHLYDIDTQNTKYDGLLQQYRILQYNNMIDTTHTDKSFFYLKEH